MRVILSGLFGLCLLAVPALAEDVAPFPVPSAAVTQSVAPPPPAVPRVADIKLTQPEIDALLDLMDAGVKSAGLAKAQNAAVLLQKILTASQGAGFVGSGFMGKGP